MLKSIQAFLTQILDYAGMFPPAKLPLEESLRHFLRYRRSPHAWMLGRFACPTTRLADVPRCVQSPEDAGLLRITALAQASSKPDDVLAYLDTDLQRIREFRWCMGQDSGTVDMLEIALPKDTSTQQLSALLPTLKTQLQHANLRGFLEIPRSLYSDLSSLSNGSIGLKLRCGGTSVDAFPGEEQIAAFIVACRAHHLPWKATAGLHHPHRFWDASLQIWHHGFFNVFGAGILALSNPLSEADLVTILADREGRSFRFDAESFAWGSWTCSLDRLIEIRSKEVLSFGCCSFEEPCDDLRALGYI